MTREKNKKLLGWGAAAVVVAALCGYVFFQSRGLLFPPRLEITSPENGATLDTRLLEVRGVAAASPKRLTLDGRDIVVDESGRFAERLLLADGYNTLEVAVEDRFGRTATRRLEVVYRPQPAPPAASSTLATSTPEEAVTSQ